MTDKSAVIGGLVGRTGTLIAESGTKSRSKNLGPSQSDEARRQWVREEWRIPGVFDRRASPLAVM
ncbi:MAG: hypothetical protein MJE77_20420, partial [Proteobacteria bacterium]|nr:hypothetical protein [Pseudomonadota bacterium]